MTQPASMTRGPAAAASPGLAVVTIVLDVNDEYRNTKAALAAHDPAARRITVHPTPATKGPLNLAFDVLAALGKKNPRMEGGGGTSEVWRQVTAWVCGYQISELTVLRAHLLSRSGLARLIELAADSGTALTLFWHARPPASWESVLPAAALTVLEDIQEAFARNRARRPVRTPPEPQPMYCPPRTPQPSTEAISEALARPLPALPISELARFRAELRRQLGPNDFACADTLYAAGMDSACAFLTGHRDYHWHPPHGDGPDPPQDTDAGTSPTGPGHTPPGSAQSAARELRLYPFAWRDAAALRSYMLSVVAASPSPGHSLALIRGAQAGFLLHGLLLAVPSDPGRTGGPGFPDAALTPQRAERLRSTVVHPLRAAALAALLLTGLPAHALSTVWMKDLSADASVLTVRNYHLPYSDPGPDFPIPVFARDVLDAARAYVSLGGGQDLDPLLEAGIGDREWIIRDTARSCDIELRTASSWARGDRAWYLHSPCHWVGDAVHANVHTDPGKERGFHVPQA